MNRTLLIHATFTVEGDDEPTLVVTRRVAWSEELTLAEVAEAEIEKACLELHRPRIEWTPA